MNTGEFTSSAALTWVKGSHSYKFGGSLQTRMEGFEQCQGGWGVYWILRRPNRSTLWRRAARRWRTTNGSPGLGLRQLPSRFAELGEPGALHQRELARQRLWPFYAQDNWKVTRKLTLDLGLRYDLQNPPLEDRNRVSSFSADDSESERRESAGSRDLPGFRAEYL